MSHATLVSRSNYFAVRDFAAFTADLDTHGVPWASLDDAAGELDTLLIDHGDRGGLPGWSVAMRVYGRWPDPDGGGPLCSTYEPVVAGRGHGASCYDDLAHLVAAHLVEGEVAVFKTAGFDSCDAPIGSAAAINCRGERIEVSLGGIVAAAAALGPNVDDYA